VRTVAALFIDPDGPYPTMLGVDAWDESRDARAYAGPHPVVAHPPCGPWSRLKHFCKFQDPSCGPSAVLSVQRWGGVLEHPADSKLFAHMGLPTPKDATDHHGGRTYEVDQCDWGHVTRKRTWIYVVRIDQPWVACLLRERRGKGTPVAAVCNGRGMVGGKRRATAEEARLTPTAFAVLLVKMARRAGAQEVA
jgi:hypothetical protein